jgi:hypothetical protein
MSKPLYENVEMRNTRLDRTRDAFGQLLRYGDPFCEEIVDILEVLTDINDDLWHSRLSSLTQANSDKIKVLLDKLVANTVIP